jgi:type IV pilus assembly protein PilO
MDLSELNELDLNNIGEWPVFAKALVIIFICALLAFGWYYFITSKQLERLDSVKAKELDLRSTFETKQDKAANLEAYRQQMVEMSESFGAMLRQLPDKTEVAALLVDVSQTGLAAGLEFELFQPGGEVNKDFYAELPITMRVVGRYHEFGRFISGLAALPRIVTIHNVSINQGGGGRRYEAMARGADGRITPGDAPVLKMEATVKTYRYLDENAAQ